MKRYDFISYRDGSRIEERDDGEYVKYEDIKKLVIKATQGTEWNGPSMEPIEREECIIMLITGEIKPAMIIDGVWIKLAGYPYDFNFDKSDVIKWRYDPKR